MGSAATGGARVAELRKTRGITQAALAHRAGISVSLLSKIEIGDRTLTPGIAATIARALQISLGALYGEAEVFVDQSKQLEALRTAAEEFPHDRQLHEQRFGPANTAASVVATEGDLGRSRDVIRLAEELTSKDTGLPPTRILDIHTSTARARLDLGDRDGAQTSLVQAWNVAPQKATVHPMSREVLRVLISLHRRSNPQLLQLAKRAGLTV